MVSSDSDDEDRRERDKFSERLKRKDKDRTRNIAIPRSGKLYKPFKVIASSHYRCTMFDPNTVIFTSAELELRIPSVYQCLEHLEKNQMRSFDRYFFPEN